MLAAIRLGVSCAYGRGQRLAGVLAAAMVACACLLWFPASGQATITFVSTTGPAGAKSFTYETIYSGTYAFILHNTNPNLEDEGGKQTYEWNMVKDDTFTVLPHNQFDKRTEVTLQADGSYTPDPVPYLENDPVAYARCTYTSDAFASEVHLRHGTYSASIAHRSNPLLPVTYGIPDTLEYVGPSVGPQATCNPPITSTGTTALPPDYGFLNYTDAFAITQQDHSYPILPCCPNYLEPTNAFFDAWGNGTSAGTTHGTIL